MALAEHLLVENAAEEEGEREAARRRLYAAPSDAPRSGRTTRPAPRPGAGPMTMSQAQALMGQVAKEDATRRR